MYSLSPKLGLTLLCGTMILTSLVTEYLDWTELGEEVQVFVLMSGVHLKSAFYGTLLQHPMMVSNSYGSLYNTKS